ncbi:putative damage-inducible protein DinB [Scopulibacillus darangshiensis]|uniref:Putative damage-inducible protein DinB n=1 Tax=Scopulibacillus darangshiensis TaxID=442528 RepID=A0A4R2P3V7_9BACL|nr:DinB family protein [Scopulibacillus darangshiensis]TCP29392.1 putative damage-inducible protein DinB [Scopulibacillus darangshiensis]
MNTNDLLILNFEEVRRRSIAIWTSIPEESLDFQPDPEAMSCQEMIRHVIEAEYLYHQILKNHGSAFLTNVHNPYESRVFTTVKEELEFAMPYRKEFLNYVKSLSNEDLSNIKIDRSDAGYIRSLGDMLLRIAYHESVHAGQLLDYLRTAGVDRAKMWD